MSRPMQLLLLSLGFCFGNSAMSQITAPAGLVPAGLSPGDTFFVIFTTSTTINACYDLDPTNIDTLATSAAAAGTQTNGVTGWKALYIHQANGAGPIVNTVQASGAWSNVTNRPIYTTAGVLVANSRDDMFDGTSNGNNGATGTDLLAPIDLDESGNVAPQYVYTGFDELGMAATGNGDGTGVNAKLGTNLGTGCRVGESPQVRRRWADSTMAADARSVYVLSPLLRVAGGVTSSALGIDW